MSVVIYSYAHIPLLIERVAIGSVPIEVGTKTGRR
jgi:hypothetical protein